MISWQPYADGNPGTYLYSWELVRVWALIFSAVCLVVVVTGLE